MTAARSPGAAQTQHRMTARATGLRTEELRDPAAGASRVTASTAAAPGCGGGDQRGCEEVPKHGRRGHPGPNAGSTHTLSSRVVGERHAASGAAWLGLGVRGAFRPLPCGHYTQPKPADPPSAPVPTTWASLPERTQLLSLLQCGAARPSRRAAASPSPSGLGRVGPEPPERSSLLP